LTKIVKMVPLSDYMQADLTWHEFVVRDSKVTQKETNDRRSEIH